MQIEVLIHDVSLARIGVLVTKCQALNAYIDASRLEWWVSLLFHRHHLLHILAANLIVGLQIVWIQVQGPDLSLQDGVDPHDLHELGVKGDAGAEPHRHIESVGGGSNEGEVTELEGNHEGAACCDGKKGE